jgi:hypothetical protein
MDGGPDFRQASIRIGGTLYRGDVEIHVDAASWYGHRHDTDPHYNGVILHVALKADTREARTSSNRSIPLLLLSDVPGFPHLRRRPSADGRGGSPGRNGLPCRGWSSSLRPEILRGWVRRLSRERLKGKIMRFNARLHALALESQAARYGNAGAPLTWKELAVREIWDQLLFEAVAECLGYGKNRRPMVELARALRLSILRTRGLGNRHAMEALLLGAAGLLPGPGELPLKEARAYVKSLRREWGEFKKGYRGPILHEAEWLFFRLRPANFPTARLAALAALLPSLPGEGFWKVVQLMRQESAGPGELQRRLLDILVCHPDGFWRTHLHLRAAGPGGAPEPGLFDPHPMGAALGRERALDIIVNALIPLLLLYARLFEDSLVSRRALRLYGRLPLLLENSVTARMRSSLPSIPVLRALDQQGMLQLYHAYCARGRCSACAIGSGEHV